MRIFDPEKDDLKELIRQVDIVQHVMKKTTLRGINASSDYASVVSADCTYAIKNPFAFFLLETPERRILIINPVMKNLSQKTKLFEYSVEPHEYWRVQLQAPEKITASYLTIIEKTETLAIVKDDVFSDEAASLLFQSYYRLRRESALEMALKKLSINDLFLGLKTIEDALIQKKSHPIKTPVIRKNYCLIVVTNTDKTVLRNTELQSFAQEADEKTLNTLKNKWITELWLRDRKYIQHLFQAAPEKKPTEDGYHHSALRSKL